MPIDRDVRFAFTAGDLGIVAMSLVGIVILIGGLQDLAVATYTWFSLQSRLDVDSVVFWWTKEQEEIIRATVGLTAGVVLIVGRTALGRAWRRVRGLD